MCESITATQGRYIIYRSCFPSSTDLIYLAALFTVLWRFYQTIFKYNPTIIKNAKKSPSRLEIHTKIKYII